MNVKQIRKVGRSLRRFLEEFADCYGRCDTRRYLPIYVDGQMSDLQRKSAEPIALRAKIPPRSLQAFLEFLEWNEDRVVDRVQWIVVRDHAHPWAIGLVDETGCPKDGSHTACTQRQWCGSLGKKENCVVSVHVGYTVGDFHCVLDSDLFVPESWANDPAKRAEVGMPAEIVHRTKAQMALDQIRRALGNGIRVAAWTFDEHYGQSYEFLDSLDGLGQIYVAEVPCTFCGWTKEPAKVYRATGQGLPRRGLRLAKTAPAVSAVRNLLRHSRAFTGQPWTPIHIKNGEAGPIVREVKVVPFFMRRDGLPTRAHWLIVARDPQRHEEIKFFVSNAAPGSPLEWLVHVGYSRWPIEQCFREEKDELGFDHFEVRGWQPIHRHLYLSQVSHLFLNKTRAQLAAEESSGNPVPPTGLFFPPHRKGSPTGAAREFDAGADSLRRFPVAPGHAPRPPCRAHHSGRRGRGDPLPPPAQHLRKRLPHQNPKAGPTQLGYRCRTDPLLFG